MDQVAVLALVQREAGGNTAEVLDQVTDEHPRAHGRAPPRQGADGPGQVLVRGRRRRYRSASLSSSCCYNPDQLDPLFNTPIGQISGISAIFMAIVGFYVIRKIVSIEL